MAEKLSWSFTAGSSSGAGIASNGSMEIEASTSVLVSLDADMNAAASLALQLKDVDKVAFIAIVASLDDGSVEVKVGGADAIALAGPLALYGGAVKLFASDLTTLEVQNKHKTEAAELSILIGRRITTT